MEDYKQIIRESYDRFAKDFSNTRQEPWQRVVELLEEQNKENSLLLDAGAGNGRHGVIARKLGYRVVGMDASKNMIKLAIEQEGGDFFVIGDLTDLPFKDEVFDCSIAIASLHHLLNEGDRLKGSKELKRVLKKEGRCIISVWKYEQARFEGKKQDLDVKWRGKYLRPYHLFRKGELKELMLHAGFKDVKENEDNGNYWGVGEG